MLHILYYQIDKRIYFFWLIIFVLAFAYMSQKILLTNEIYYASLGEQLSYERINQLVASQQEWSWVGYLLTPILYLVKFSLVALCLLSATILFKIKIAFKRLFHVALLAEAIFLLPILIKVVWFSLVENPENLQHISYFYPLSLINIFDSQNLNPWEVYPLQVLNLFEAVYWFLLAYGITIFTKNSLERSFVAVACGYGSGLFLWVVLVVFFTVIFAT